MRVHIVVHLSGCLMCVEYQVDLLLGLACVNSRVWTYVTVASCLLEGFYFLKVGFIADVSNYFCIWQCGLHYTLQTVVLGLSWLAHRLFFYNCLNISIVKGLFILIKTEDTWIFWNLEARILQSKIFNLCIGMKSHLTVKRKGNL